ncbi:hypothetical protein GCK72_006765 [Caenorhabditis remanei]|uniref:DUF1248 domain-containing protein n=1 Tax=Caenorhabditis remanei TaxID=31234 RepID=A0A6A5HJM6_CAERE|nr:hypothetical protein GCK72_006765 [Caenorhabditis remanei]KAF1766807.1 hypothetical protein GCK72_006765 [Caenorhabditis remanei]
MSPKQLTRAEVVFLTNPSEKYVDEFMKAHGNDRAVFKKGDLAQWQNSFDGYKFKVAVLKGTSRVIAMGHTCPFDPIKGTGNKPIVFMGFGWIDPEYRSPTMATLQNESCMEEVHDDNVNIVSHINEPGRRFWWKMCGIREQEDIGHRTGDAGYKSFYDAKDVTIPENLDTTGISVKNAREVPKKDIIEYDQTVHPYHREKYIISHMYDRDGYGKVAYDDDGKVIGIGQAIIYDNKKDCNLGPIYADDPRVAQAMFYEMLKDIKDSGKFVSQFEVRSSQMAPNSFQWISPFLKCKPSRVHICNLVYKHWAPKNIDRTKVYCPTHAQLFVV